MRLRGERKDRGLFKTSHNLSDLHVVFTVRKFAKSDIKFLFTNLFPLKRGAKFVVTDSDQSLDNL